MEPTPPPTPSSSPEQQVPQPSQPRVVEDQRPGTTDARLFDQRAVALASLVGSPVAGGILLGLNGAKAGRWGVAAVGFLMGLVLTYSLLGLSGYVSRYATPWVLLPVGAAIMWWVTTVMQADILKGSRRGPWPVALLVGLVTAGGLYFGLRPLLVRTAQPQPVVLRPTLATFGNKQTIGFFPGVSEEEVRRVGQALGQVGYFDKTGQHERSALMLRENGQTGQLVIMFPTAEGDERRQEVLKGFAILARQLVIDGVPVPFIIRLVTPDLKKSLGEFKVGRNATQPATGPALGALPQVPESTVPEPGAVSSPATQPGPPSAPFGQP